MKYISRILFVLAVLFVGVGTAQAQSDDLKIVKNATGVTIETYVSSTEPGTSYSASGTEAENVQHDQYLVLKVTPADGKWLYNEMIEVQVVGSPGGALAPPRRSPEVKIAEAPTSLSTNHADGTGYYYYKIPSECTAANGYKSVVVTGTAVSKIDLSSASIDGTGKVITKTTDGWTATITLDEVSWTYDKIAHCPAISTFTLTNGTKSFDNTAAQVAISGAQTNAGDHNATLSAVTGGCFLNSKSVPFSIAKAPTEITLNTPPGGGEVGQMYVDDIYVILKSFTPAEAGSLTYTLSKESVVTVDASGGVTAVGEGEVTITVSFAGNENYAAAEDKSMKIKVSKLPTEITVAPANPEWGDTWQLKVWDEVGIGATLTPAEAGSLSYSSSDESVVKIEGGKIKAVGAGTATITVSFAGNTKYAAAESKTVTVNVSLNDASVSVDKENVELLVEETHTIIPTTTPVGLTVTYTPDASGVVSVDASGKVTALKEGTATITVSVGGDGVYISKSTTVTVHVTKNLDESNITLAIPTEGYIYDATAKEPAVTVKYGEKTLVQGTDYNVSYSNNVNAGENTATVTVTDMAGGDYNVSGTKKFSIAKASLTVKANNKEITYGEAPANNGVTYSGFVGTEGASVLGGTLAYDYDYTQYGNVGDYNITPKGLTSGNYDITFVKGTLKVNAQNISSATVNITPLSYVYDGTAKEPTVTVVLGGKTLTADTDYDVEFSDNTTPGTATVTVTAKGNYAGTATGTFQINAVTVNVSVVDIGNGDKLGGATVQVLDKDGNLLDSWVSTKENHEIVGLKADAEYTLRETVAPGGYAIATDITFTIDENGKVTSTGTVTEEGVLLVDNAKTKVKVSVVDVANGEEIEGATIQVLDGDGKVVEEWVSTDESHSIEGLKTGVEYTLRETVAPDGYTIATDCTFTIDETGKVTSTGTVTEEGVLLVENTKIKTLGTIEVSPSEFTYDGQTHKPTVTAKDTDGNGIPADQYTVSYQDSKGNALTSPTDADTYTVVITDKTGTGYDNYEVNGTSTFVINKKALTITAKEQSVNFGTAITQGTAQVLTTGLAAGQVLADVTLSQSTTSVTTNGKITPSSAVVKKGDTDVTANYIIEYKTGKLIINASTAASAIVTANDRTYDGSTQDLVTIGAITNGATGTAADVVFYESATSTTPLTAIPQGTNAGTYEVYYEVTPDGDHTAPARAKVTVTISPIAAVVTITGHNNTTVYDGKEHSVSGYNVEISTPLYAETDFTFSGTATAKRTEVGMTTMGLKVEQFTNTNNNFSTVTFNVTDGFQTITSRDGVIVKITGHSNTADYDGTAHTVTGYDVEISNPLYKETDFTFSGTAKATRTDAGKTMMGLDESQFTSKNTNFGTVKFEVTDGYQTISPIAAAVTITGHNNTTTYDGNEHSVTGYDVTFSNVLYKEGDFTFSGTAEAKRIDEGTTQMGLAKEQFANNSPNFDPVTFTVIDGYQTITAVTDVVVTITGHSNTLDYDGTAHTVSGYDVEISNPLYKVTDFTFSGTAEAARTDAGTTNMGLDAAQFTNTNTDFTTVTFNVTDGYQTINPITATVTIEGHYDMAVYDGTEHRVTGYDVTFSNDLYKQTDFTFSGTASAAQTYKGTTYMGLSEGQFANISANFSTVTFTVIDGYQTITPRTLTITANEQTIDYGTGIATGLGQVSAEGLQGSDKLTAVTLVASTSDLTNDGEITASAAVVKNGDTDVTGNYDINYAPGTLIIEYVMTINAGYMTFCSPFDLQLSTGMKAFTVTEVSKERGVVITEQKAIGKDVPMILQVETGGTFRLRKGEPQNFSSCKEFVGVTTASGINVLQIGGEVFVLKSGLVAGESQFVWSREGIIPQYRCFVVLNDAAGARALNISTGEASGISTIYYDPMMTEGTWYDMNGRKLDGKPTKKGLYIYNGKKTVIK